MPKPRINNNLNKDKSVKHILVIDDDPTLTKMVESRLNANGYAATATNDAALGLETAMKEIPDLIVLDVMMPIINGYNMCSLLKSEQKTKKIPIIILTSRSEEQDKVIGKEVGVDAYLTKPVKMEELLTAVQDLLKTR